MFKRIVSCALLISLIVLCFCSCSKQEKQSEAELNKYTESFLNYFDTVSTIVGFDKTEEAFMFFRKNNINCIKTTINYFEDIPQAIKKVFDCLHI